jgi:hypothetical protein
MLHKQNSIPNSILIRENEKTRSVGGSRSAPQSLKQWYPRRESNPGTRFRKPLLYPLSYEGARSAGVTGRAAPRPR